ncbi:unnamed protein product [Adineta ricciae]|uniref:Uncharacterized protein n=1 Tax=Adineta ricciae TaxID=249248 RepID=A0A814WD91_ADIRI|nr:unnamed protein product [Adineta ricciae]CAF1203667.1 unnamed protein product [Adineta ricciae]
MSELEKDQSIVNGKTDEHHSHKKKSSSKKTTRESETNGEKKRKAPKIVVGDDPVEDEHVYESSPSRNVGREASDRDQEVPVKPKKKRAPKIEADGDETKTTDEPVKKKKSKTPKPLPVDDEFQMIDASAVNEVEPYVESKPKKKKSKKSKTSPKPHSDSFEDLQVTNLDDPIPEMVDYTSEMYPEDIPILDSGLGEYQQSILDAFNNLSAKMNFAEYIGADDWCVAHKPKSGRAENKSRIRKMLPGSNKADNKPGAKPGVPKQKLLTRFRTGVTSLVRDPNNMLFGEQPTHELNPDYDEPEEVDTDDLHRYAQKLRELEDQDREVNPEYLVLHDGKTVYAVHEADEDGKVKLSKRKPIYDRMADQKPDDQTDKKKLLARLRAPFTRNKDGKDSKSATTTPDTRSHRKSSRKSLNDEMAIAPQEDPILI